MILRICGLILVFVLDFAHICECVKAEPVKAIYGRQVSYYRGELIWFVEGINEKLLSYENVFPGAGYYPAQESIDPIIAVNFDSLCAPFFIKSISAFVSEEDYFPDLPGDQFTPFYLTLYSDLDGFPDSMLIDPVEVAASGAWGDGGEWVPAETGHLIDNRDCIWAAAFWQHDLPFAPCMCYDPGIPNGRSVFRHMEGGEQVWSHFQYGNFRIRAGVICNDLDGTLAAGQGTAVPDSFRIYSSGQPIVYPENEFYDTTVVGNLHCRVELHSPQNYFCVTAFSDETESPPSDIVLISGSTQKRADVRFSPEMMEINMPPNGDTSINIVITNKNDRDIDYRIAGINWGEAGDSSGIAFSFQPSEGNIPDDYADTLTAYISLGDLSYGIREAEITFNFWDSIQGYMDEEYPVTFIINELTSADDPAVITPAQIYLGQNYPNPFNLETMIPYSLPPGSSDARAEIINLLGRKVASFSLNGAGNGYLVWDGRDEGGSDLPSGIYFLRIRAAGGARICKMIMLK